MEYPTNPKYQSRHHEDLAAFVNTALPSGLTKASQRRIAKRLADRLGGDNPLFDRDRFLKACGVETDD